MTTPLDLYEADVVYRDVPGFPGYRVGDDGSVWSCRNTRGRFLNDWHRLKTMTGSFGYPAVNLSRNSKSQRIRIHILVLTVFVGPCPPGVTTPSPEGDGFSEHA